MNGIQTNSAMRRLAHFQKAALIDAVAIRNALAGSPAALSAIEEDLVLEICDIYRLDQEIVANGLGICVRTLQRRIFARRNEIVSPRMLEVLTEQVREPVDALIDAVAGGDGATVAGILFGCDPAQTAALVIVLASLAADRRPVLEASDGH